ncbi:hypothetical protein [Myxacorys almedinensis]|uniref:hypothetical protein n=1 Tax=Myxacorys almedinensis TaxID=2651157 RepID=UPI00192F0900|nr:hypothetical protein [Myxacorys almedinensis]
MEFSIKPLVRPWMMMVVEGAIALAAIAGIISMQRTQLQKPSLWVESPTQAEQQESIRLSLLSKSPSFGFENLIADWAFLNFLQYYGDEAARSQAGYGLTPKYFDIVTQRDPRFAETYLFLSGTLSHQLGQPEQALTLMQRGMAALSPQMTPKAFTVWRFAALDQLLLLGDVPGAVQSLEMAAAWSGETEEYQAIAPVFRETAAFLKTNPDSKLVRFQAWTTVFAQAGAIGDRKTQARARQEILALGGIEKADEQGQPFFTLPIPAQPAKSTSKTP